MRMVADASPSPVFVDPKSVLKKKS
jgi:hypothetical protein